MLLVPGFGSMLRSYENSYAHRSYVGHQTTPTRPALLTVVHRREVLHTSTHLLAYRHQLLQMSTNCLSGMSTWKFVASASLVPVEIVKWNTRPCTGELCGLQLIPHQGRSH